MPGFSLPAFTQELQAFNTATASEDANLPSTIPTPQAVSTIVKSAYPFLLSTSKSRTEAPGFWGTLKQKHLLAVGTERAKQHLLYPNYAFPEQFYSDVRSVLHELFPVLSNPQTASDISYLRPLMTTPLAERFALSTEALYRHGSRLRIKLNTPVEKLKIRLTSLEFVYGPYPAPPNYVAQRWVDLVTLMIPKDDAPFISAPRHREVMKQAMDDGCFMRATVKVDGDLEVGVFEGVEVPEEERVSIYGEEAFRVEDERELEGLTQGARDVKMMMKAIRDKHDKSPKPHRTSPVMP
ncbi:hypothetical protein HK097_003240, partial [Rhizophlyctis rosea]